MPKEQAPHHQRPEFSAVDSKTSMIRVRWRIHTFGDLLKKCWSDLLFSVSRQRSPTTTGRWRCARQPDPADAAHDPNQCRSYTVAPCHENGSMFRWTCNLNHTHRRSTDVLASLQVPWVQRHKGPVAPAAWRRKGSTATAGLGSHKETSDVGSSVILFG